MVRTGCTYNNQKADVGIVRIIDSDPGEWYYAKAAMKLTQVEDRNSEPEEGFLARLTLVARGSDGQIAPECNAKIYSTNQEKHPGMVFKLPSDNAVDFLAVEFRAHVTDAETPYSGGNTYTSRGVTNLYRIVVRQVDRPDDLGSRTEEPVGSNCYPVQPNPR